MEEYGLLARAERSFELIEPLGYLDFVRLMDTAERVATDSGGVQKESFFLETPCVTMRPETEWTETVDSGWNVLVGADADRIHAAIRADRETDADVQPYGDGKAGHHIVSALARHVGDDEVDIDVEVEPEPAA